MLSKATVLTLAAVAASFAQGVDPKGIFVTPAKDDAPGSRPAVKYGIRLNRDGQERSVASSYRFRSGDRFQFRFEMSQRSYVYLLHRELLGNPDTMEQYVGAKGIVVVREDDAKRQDNAAKYSLLWPANGENVRLAAHQAQTVPQSQYFQFDEKAGLEKIVLVVSPKPLDLEKVFPGATGNKPPKQSAGGRNDSDNDVLGQLRKDLDAMERNTASAEAPSDKGICVGECDSYSAPRNPANPFLVVIDLRHFR